jgi:hypothetical protein
MCTVHGNGEKDAYHGGTWRKNLCEDDSAWFSKFLHGGYKSAANLISKLNIWPKNLIYSYKFMGIFILY